MNTPGLVTIGAQGLRVGPGTREWALAIHTGGGILKIRYVKVSYYYIHGIGMNSVQNYNTSVATGSKILLRVKSRISGIVTSLVTCAASSHFQLCLTLLQSVRLVVRL